MRRGRLAALACAALPACVHHPTRVELGTGSREEALRRCESALRMRFPAVLRADPRFPVLRTTERYAGPAGLERSRAFVSLVPGEEGWAADVTVVREQLDDEPDALTTAPRWRYVGRDQEIETFLESRLREERAASSPFVDSPSSAPAPGPRRRA